MSGIHDVFGDDDVTGNIVGGDYFCGVLCYEGRPQSNTFYEPSELGLKERAEGIIEEKRKEIGSVFSIIYPKDSWELKIL